MAFFPVYKNSTHVLPKKKSPLEKYKGENTEDL